MMARRQARMQARQPAPAGQAIGQPAVPPPVTPEQPPVQTRQPAGLMGGAGQLQRKIRKQPNIGKFIGGLLNR